MKTILCFGDSNTWGAKPMKSIDAVERFERDERWPSVLGRELGGEYEVIAEGLNGRTTVWEDPIEGYKNGSAYLIPCLDTPQPLDLVIICSYVQVDDSECRQWKGVRVFVDEKNTPRDIA